MTDDDLEEEDEDDSKYWFTRDKIDKITLVHDYLENINSIGKVISFASIVRVAEDLDGRKKTRRPRNGCSLYKNTETQ